MMRQLKNKPRKTWGWLLLVLGGIFVVFITVPSFSPHVKAIGVASISGHDKLVQFNAWVDLIYPLVEKFLGLISAILGIVFLVLEILNERSKLEEKPAPRKRKKVTE